MRTPWGAADVRLSVPGEQMVPDALAAAAAAGALGVEPEAAAAALGHAAVSGGRMQVVRTADGVTIVNDAYNANPTSMAAALRAARAMAGDGRWLAVLGEMAELGPFADEEHARVGEQLAATGRRRAGGGRAMGRRHRGGGGGRGPARRSRASRPPTRPRRSASFGR